MAKLHFNNDIGELLGVILDSRFHVNGCAHIADFGRSDLGGPLADVYRAAKLQHDLAIDAGAGVPARAMFGRVDADGHHIAAL
jgi:hypothetical protein